MQKGHGVCDPQTRPAGPGSACEIPAPTQATQPLPAPTQPVNSRLRNERVTASHSKVQSAAVCTRREGQPSTSAGVCEAPGAAGRARALAARPVARLLPPRRLSGGAACAGSPPCGRRWPRCCLDCIGGRRPTCRRSTGSNSAPACSEGPPTALFAKTENQVWVFNEGTPPCLRRSFNKNKSERARPLPLCGPWAMPRRAPPGGHRVARTRPPRPARTRA